MSISQQEGFINGGDGGFMATNKKKTKKGGTQSRYSENWLPVKAITNGRIVLDNGEMVTGVKVMPQNIFILDPDMQESVLVNLKNFYNMLDYEFWLVVADRPVDISMYMSQLQLLYNKTQDQKIRKLIAADINKGNMFMKNDIVDTEYFIIFKEKDKDVIEKRVRRLISGLAQASLNSKQTSNDDLRSILDNFLNVGSTSPFGTVIVK